MSDDLRRTIALLEELAGDRARLAELAPEMRRALLEAAGRLARPGPEDRRALARAFRRKDRARARAHDARIVEATRLRALRHSPIFVPAREETPAPEGELADARACYVCKAPYRTLHFFYDSMCPACAERNWKKRTPSLRLDGRVAVVTGGRIKIGFHTVTMLLRAGARVVATTRFPHDAAARFAREPDFADWRDRLDLYGLDLRHAPSVELFAAHLERTLPRLDFLINNAAQTVRRPPRFYAPLLAGEETALPDELAPLVARHQALIGEGAGDEAAASVVRWGEPAIGLTASARLSQVPCAPGDVGADDEALFPAGRLDADLQQVDLRRANSWRMGAAEVPLPELLEVHLVNAIAPFLLCARLKAFMADGAGDRHVINVSAMEAQFARKKKTDKHPHTNMAKAALNMLTRTSAVDWAASGIWMNSVDTGWVTDEDPVHHAERKQRDHDFYPPLDAVDGAARVIDPIVVGFETGRHPWGLFFKDYEPAPW